MNKIGQKLSKLLSKNLKCWQKDGITEFRNHGILDMLKTVYPLKLCFAGGITKQVLLFKTFTEILKDQFCKNT